MLLIGLLAANPAIAELTEDQAFPLAVRVINGKQIEFTWHIADKHYLYQNQLHIIDESNTELLTPKDRPKGHVIHDPDLGTYSVYENELMVRLPWHINKNITQLLVRYQGCAKDGFCYLPITKLVEISGNKIVISDTTLQEFPSKFTAYNLASMLENGLSPLTLLIFLCLGILLSFTPCVLPMIPIVVNLIIGTKGVSSRYKAFILSSSYVLGMAVCYTIAGIVAGMLGATLQAWLQQPAILISLSVFLVVLALNQFDMINISLPHFNKRLHKWSEGQLQGSYIGAFVVGLLSALIVSPCITPPLIGALTYISQNGNPVVGGAALFCLGIGMGIPLIIVAMLSSMVLPKAGEWMNAVKNLAGVALLGLAIWLMQRILPTYIIIILWGALCILMAFLLKAFHAISHAKKFSSKLFKTIGLLLAIFGGSLILHTVYMHFIVQEQAQESLHWHNINTIEELNTSLKIAETKSQYTLLDFTAEWCTNCQRIEKTVFNDSKVIKELTEFNLVRVDMTHMSNKQKPLLQNLKIYGPPVIVIFNPQGHEIPEKRVVGDIDTEEMLRILQTM